MIYLIQANGYDINMHAKIQCMNMYGCLQLISSSFPFLEFYIIQYCIVKNLVNPNA
jgi:hypothetical protein